MTDTTQTSTVHPVDQKLPALKLVPLALQHVLVMYAGAVAVPLIIGRALKLSPEDVAFLISADLFACGIATIVQSLGFPGIGIRLPVMMGVTFASVGPMLAMANAPEIGLLGIVIGSVVAAALGKMSFAKVATAPWVDVVVPFHFGVPQFHLVSIVTMCIVMIVVMIESLGMFLALGEMTGKKIDEAALTRGLRADGVGTLIGGIFNTFPYTSFSQNVGLVGVTGIRSRWVTVCGGVIMLILGLLPKMSALVEAVPQVVLGGAGLVMFGMVAATGARILTGVDFKANKNNLFVVAISVGFGTIPLVAPTFFKAMPEALKPLLDSGILLAAIAAVLLNAFFNGAGSAVSARQQAASGAASAEHV